MTPAAPRRRGNPRWMSPLAMPAEPAQPSQWDRLVAGRTVEEALADRKVWAWVEKHWRSAYVPTEVLQAMGKEEGMGEI